MFLQLMTDVSGTPGDVTEPGPAPVLAFTPPPVYAVHDGASRTSSLAIALSSGTASRTTALLDGIYRTQRDGILPVWGLLPNHLRDYVVFDLNACEWTTSVFALLGELMWAFPGVFSKSKRNLTRVGCYCSNFPFCPTQRPSYRFQIALIQVFL